MRVYGSIHFNWGNILLENTHPKTFIVENCVCIGTNYFGYQLIGTVFIWRSIVLGICQKHTINKAFTLKHDFECQI